MNKNILVILLLILAVCCVIFNTQISQMFTAKTHIEQPETTADSNIIPLQTNSIIEIPVAQPISLSYKSKSFVYKVRKEAVAKSIFATQNYEPSEYVFGQIENFKPWIACDVCKDRNDPYTIEGPSEETRFILNPAMLVAIEYPFSFNDEGLSWCKSPIENLIPKKISYDGSKKEISVTYEKLPFTTNGNHTFYIFNGLNAKDLGYQYAYLDNSKSTYKVDFSNEYNFSHEVIEFQNYIHVGGSCGVEGGCNNGSPRQSFLEFKENNTEYLHSNREIYIKLWKNRPNSPYDKADITEKIILEES
ncbi:hypothetical protein HDR58_05155 [bacterium]|nr:hypothetical protein [bacterium]